MKYLQLPPGYTNPVPEGYIPVRFGGYTVLGLFQPITVGGGTVEGAHPYTQQMEEAMLDGM